MKAQIVMVLSFLISTVYPLHSIADEVTFKAGPSYRGKNISFFIADVPKNCGKKCTFKPRVLAVKKFTGKPIKFVAKIGRGQQICAAIAGTKNKFQCKKANGVSVSLQIW